MRVLRNIFYMPYYLWITFRIWLVRRKIERLREYNRELRRKIYGNE